VLGLPSVIHGIEGNHPLGPMNWKGMCPIAISEGLFAKLLCDLILRLSTTNTLDPKGPERLKQRMESFFLTGW
jgi:hypothetical protein